MAERIFESAFHKRYVGETEGSVVEPNISKKSENTVPKTRIEDVLALYRRYVGDPTAELPESIKKSLLINGTENDGK